MKSGTSFKALQWLTYVEETHPILTDQHGERIKLQHAYYRGEKDFNGWFADGYANVDGEHFFFEFLGDHWHAGCPDCSADKIKDWVWGKKREYLESQGQLITIRECQFDKLLPRIKHNMTPNFLQVLLPSANEKPIMKAIGELFGFIVADVTTPQN